MPDLRFFIGKGGAGKTTVSAAYAVMRAGEHGTGRVLLMSTDPAHSLADVLQADMRGEKRSIRVGRSVLEVWQLDAERHFRAFLDRHREAVLSLLERGTLFTREELEPLLDTTIPGMAEVAALMAIADLTDSADYSEIVIDTAPVGHTLRLFQLPEQFLRFLRLLEVAASRDEVLAAHFAQKHLAPQPFVQEWKRQADAVRSALIARRTRLTLVTTPQSFALEQSVRAVKILADSDPPMRISEIVLNRAVMDGSGCERCDQRAGETRAAREFLRREFPKRKILVGEDTGAPVAGHEALLHFGRHVFAGARLRHAALPSRAPDIELSRAAWPRLAAPLSLTLGKGGVGKTTISAALAYNTRRRQAKTNVTICSIDPAPSLDDAFQQPVGDQAAPVLGDRRLLAMEMDAEVAFRKWTDSVRAKLDDAFGGSAGGVHVDLTFERDLLHALLDMVPPGMDELAATFRIMDLLASGPGRIVIDMAPTGHALELLRMPERIQLWARLLLRALAPHRGLALARDVAVEIAELGQRARDLDATLHDRRQAAVFAVMLAEPLPDRESERLVAQLDAMQMTPDALFVNRILPMDGDCRRCTLAAAWQRATLARLQRWYRGTLYGVPEQAAEIAGRSALNRFTRALWQIGLHRKTRES